MKKTVLSLLAALAVSMGVARADTAMSATLTGKLVDVAAYVTKDHNMDAMHMKGSAMHAGAMESNAMHPEAMQSGAMASNSSAMSSDHMGLPAACQMLGLVSSSGTVYLVVTQEGTMKAQSLCKEINTTVTLSGKVYSSGGMHVFLVQ